MTKQQDIIQKLLNKEKTFKRVTLFVLIIFLV